MVEQRRGSGDAAPLGARRRAAIRRAGQQPAPRRAARAGLVRHARRARGRRRRRRRGARADARARCTSADYLRGAARGRRAEPVVMPELRAARPGARHPGQRRRSSPPPTRGCGPRSPPPSGCSTAPASPTPSAARPATTPAPTSSAATATSTTPPRRSGRSARRRAAGRHPRPRPPLPERDRGAGRADGRRDACTRCTPAPVTNVAAGHGAAAQASGERAVAFARRPDADAYLAEVAASIEELAADAAALVVSLGYDTVAGDPHGGWGFAPDDLRRDRPPAGALGAAGLRDPGGRLRARRARRLQPRLRDRPARRRRSRMSAAG